MNPRLIALLKENSLSRRSFVKIGLTMPFISTIVKANRKNITPSQTAGPFYPNWTQTDLDADLTHISGSKKQATGEFIEITGRVLTSDLEPVAGAMVELWQANAYGRYKHKADSNPAPLDENFQGWAQVITDANGFYRFKTILPGSYPATKNWKRPPHIHFKISKRGFVDLTTQMYFAGHPLNEADSILQQHSKFERDKLIVKFTNQISPADGKPVKSGIFNIVLDKA